MTRFRCTLHWLRAAAVLACGGLWIAKRQLKLGRSIVVLAFHRVLDDTALRRTNSLAGMTVKQRTFEALTSYVARNYEAVHVGQGLVPDGPPALRLAFTFDDGWLDTCTTALPIATSHQVPMAVFACPSLTGSPAPFWPERVAALLKALLPEIGEGQIEGAIGALKHRQYFAQSLAEATSTASEVISRNGADVDRTLTWEQLANMARAGVTIGSHTQTHKILTAVPEDCAISEVWTSKAAIERRLHRSCSLFSYPNGGHSPLLEQLVEAAGYERAFSMATGAWDPRSSPYAIPRINICEQSVTGPGGRFSRLRFEYTVFWRAWWAGRKPTPRQERSGQAVVPSPAQIRKLYAAGDLPDQS